MRAALLRQWVRLVDGVRTLELDRRSRVEGWRNREVVAHLAAQPLLLRRFLRTAGPEVPTMTLADNLAGTRRLGPVIDGAAIDGAAAGRLDLDANVATVTPALLSADLTTTVTTIQGSIRLADYLVTRCVEAVVHGRDLVPAVAPDREALEISAQALTDLLERTHRSQVAVATTLPALDWVEIATGRRAAPDALAGLAPLVS